MEDETEKLLGKKPLSCFCFPKNLGTLSAEGKVVGIAKGENVEVSKTRTLCSFRVYKERLPGNSRIRIDLCSEAILRGV